MGQSNWPTARFVVLTLHPIYRAAALAAAFLLKGCSREDLLRTLRGLA
ncbi:hypothetical protein EKD04_007930 [Chloroflexales bacterium ZM16-3]|nr:hypothetical protein [Chloroflexales bacterium ZM16-3]